MSPQLLTAHLTFLDAEDAYQRGLEILLTKAPAIPDRELLPWLKTVVLRTFVPTGRSGGGCWAPTRAPVSPEHLDAYLGEFTFRFNRRTSRRRGMLFYRLLEQAVATDPVTYRQLVADRGRAPVGAG